MADTKKFDLVDIDKLIPYIRNTRTHSKEQINQLRSSLREFGFVSPAVIDASYNILVGHGRIEAAKAEGYKKVPCVYVEGLTETQRRAYIIADNKLAENAGWDKDMLSVELADLDDQAFDLSLTGFSDKELSSLFDVGKKAQDDDFDLDKATEDEPFAKSGDLWLLGSHRLLVGDATKKEDVDRLMDGKTANLCIIDPPYNCDYTGGTGMKIKNDNMSEEDFYKFLLSAFTNIYNVLADGAAIYIFHSDAEKVNFYNACVNAGFHYSTTCIWVKDSLVLGRMDYQMRHEPIIYAFKDTARHEFYNDRKQTTVWEFDRPKKSKYHPTSKSIPLLAYPMKNSSMENSIVVDLFGGGGSTLITAEQLNRICYTMELDPQYASAIVRRYTALKGNTSDIQVVRSGETLACDDVWTPSEKELDKDTL